MFKSVIVSLTQINWSVIESFLCKLKANLAIRLQWIDISGYKWIESNFPTPPPKKKTLQCLSIAFSIMELVSVKLTTTTNPLVDTNLWYRVSVITLKIKLCSLAVNKIPSIGIQDRFNGLMRAIYFKWVEFYFSPQWMLSLKIVWKPWYLFSAFRTQ